MWSFEILRGMEPGLAGGEIVPIWVGLVRLGRGERLHLACTTGEQQPRVLSYRGYDSTEVHSEKCFADLVSLAF